MKRILLLAVVLLTAACGPHIQFNEPKPGNPQCMTYVDNKKHKDLSGFYCRVNPNEATTTTTEGVK